MDWNTTLLEQLTFHWENQARPRLDGLTDEEYRWEPVPGAWNVRPRAEATTPMAAGSGDMVIDWEWPAPEPTPVTTIAWRLGHVIVGVFGVRNASHFGGPAIDYASFDYPADAASALAALDDGYARWVKGVGDLDEARLTAPIGPAEPFPEASFAALVLHINREAIHHLAEIALLRDLWAAGRR